MLREIREVTAPKEVNEPEIEGIISTEHIKVLSLGNTLIPCSVPADHAAVGTKFGNFNTHPPTLEIRVGHSSLPAPSFATWPWPLINISQP